LTIGYITSFFLAVLGSLTCLISTILTGSSDYLDLPAEDERLIMGNGTGTAFSGKVLGLLFDFEGLTSFT
jgi:hypothetical protein